MNTPKRQPLGYMLVEKGYITQAQLTKALEYQCRLPPGSHMELGEVLVSFGYITIDKLTDVLGEQPGFETEPIGQALLAEGVIGREQLSQALIRQFGNNPENKHLGTWLIELGFTTREAIEKALKHHISKQNKTFTPAKAPHPIGRILIEKGQITESDLEDAVSYQCKLPRNHKPLGEILVELGFITQAQLREALNDQPHFEKDPVGKILVEQGVVDQAQLSHALSLQFGQNPDKKRLGTLLVDLGYASRQTIENAINHYYEQKKQKQSVQKAPQPIGKILIEKGYISESDLADAVAYQCKMPRDHKPIGEILVEWGYINQAQLDEVLGQQPQFEQDPIGQILIDAGIISKWQLSHALCVQFEPHPRSKKLGDILIDMGYATRQEIEAALRDYYNRNSQ